MVVTTDSTGQYLAQLTAGKAALDADGSRVRCEFAAPSGPQPRATLDTLLGFARFTQLPALQTVNLRERPAL